MQEAILLIGIMLVATLFGLPVGFALLGASFYLISLEGLSLQLFATRFLHSLNSFAFLAVPFFMLTGQLMNSGGITKRIFSFAEDLVGHFQGGLAQVNILASMIFAGISGAAVADAAGLGTIEIEAMTKRGYDKEITVAVTAASATLGPIIPPSLILVIIGIAGEYSIGALLIGGLIPGLLLGVLMMVLTYLFARNKKYPTTKRPSRVKFFTDFKLAAVALGGPVIIIGGVMSGYFTATESGAIAALYSFIVGVFFTKELTIKRFMECITETARMTGLILFLLAAANLFGWLLTFYQVPLQVTNFLINLSPNVYVILIGVVILYLFLGTIMEAAAIVVMTVPVLSPALMMLGVDPIHLGVLIGISMSIGTITPPLGTVMFIVCAIADLDFPSYMRAITPYLILLIVFLIGLVFLPILITFLPRVMGLG
jgi:C4-dicarboxylate transporter, DctM subunit